MINALLVIDVQESFRQQPEWEVVSDPGVVEAVDRLVVHARRRGDLVVWILHTEPGTDNVFDPAIGHVRLMDGLTPETGESILTKTSHSAFTTTHLQQLLSQHEVEQVSVCGIRTEQCCETTARAASDMGYRVEFIVDATATHPIEHRDAAPGRSWTDIAADPRTLPAADVISRTEYALAGRFATIRTVEDVVAQVA